MQEVRHTIDDELNGRGGEDETHCALDDDHPHPAEAPFDTEGAAEEPIRREVRQCDGAKNYEVLPRPFGPRDEHHDRRRRTGPGEQEQADILFQEHFEAK